MLKTTWLLSGIVTQYCKGIVQYSNNYCAGHSHAVFKGARAQVTVKSVGF